MTALGPGCLDVLGDRICRRKINALDLRAFAFQVDAHGCLIVVPGGSPLR